MDEGLFDDLFDGLATASGVGGANRQRNLPFLVHGKNLSGSGPHDHFLSVARLDIEGAREERLFLDPEDPLADSADPSRYRPGIAHLAFVPFAEALRVGDRARQEALMRSDGYKHFVQDGGSVLAEGVEETDEGFVARWISPLRKAADDPQNLAYIGFTTVRPGRSGFDVEHVQTERAIMTWRYDELRGALSRTLDVNDHHLGTPGFYLRVVQADASGQSRRMMIAGEAAPDRGLTTLQRRRNGTTWDWVSPANLIDTFFASPRGAPLSRPDWRGAAVEVLPVTVRKFSTKIEDRMRARGVSPRAGFALTGADGKAVQAYTRATSRVFVAFDFQTGAAYTSVVTKVKPVEPGVIRLVDVPSVNFDLEVAPVEAAFVPVIATVPLDAQPGEPLLL